MSWIRTKLLGSGPMVQSLYGSFNKLSESSLYGAKQYERSKRGRHWANTIFLFNSGIIRKLLLFPIAKYHIYSSVLSSKYP